MEFLKTSVGIIRVDYKIRFERYTPKVCIYSIENGLLWREGFIGIRISTGHNVEDAHPDIECNVFSELDTKPLYRDIGPFTGNKRKTIEQAEEDLIRLGRERKATVIKVEKRQYIDPAFSVYIDLYSEEFSLLKGRAEKLFRDEIRENPDLGFPLLEY